MHEESKGCLGLPGGRRADTPRLSITAGLALKMCARGAARAIQTGPGNSFRIRVMGPAKRAACIKAQHSPQTFHRTGGLLSWATAEEARAPSTGTPAPAVHPKSSIQATRAPEQQQLKQHHRFLQEDSGQWPENWPGQAATRWVSLLFLVPPGLRSPGGICSREHSCQRALQV